MSAPKQPQEVIPPPPPPDADPELLRIDRTLRQMPSLTRNIFLVHRLDDFTYAEIAEQTGLTVAQVEKHVAKAMYQLLRAAGGRPVPWWRRLF